MKYSLGLLGFVSLLANAQTIERHPVDIIYGDEIIRAEHQVVMRSQEAVAIIPVEKSSSARRPNVVVSANNRGMSYLEENAIAAREQAIYDEVNKRTEEAPFTVLFTGNVPQDILEKRLRMMPEIGVFGDQKEAGGAPQSNSRPDVGQFSPVGGERSSASSNGAKSAPATNEEKLERLIGG
ncbi:hypothetical protein HGG82_00395 [Marinomonas sp. M1K-6]|uniref:Uncharacterized protein n=1 Tax=Marinomonas profundi TaxID=2726122 RepID=A0A847QVY7_9GAMM|nr:hypothetical protein [Marinomonas profundi]NLQ16079.1 hypothetical protein [Marinomonas profundi]UDV03334.1 hypothetical protein J8N69_00605 [Marinomonas profundi]